MTCGRKKAFIGAIVGAGVGVAKGVAGIISKRKQAQKQQQQDYLNTVLQARGTMTTDLNNNENLQEDFESKFVMKCGGRKRSACGKAVKMACGGRKKAQLGAVNMNGGDTFNTTQNLNEVTVTAKGPNRQIQGFNVKPKTIDINAENAKLQSFNNTNNNAQSSSTTLAPTTSPTGGMVQASTIGDISNTAGKIEAGLASLGSIAGSIGNMTGKFKCGGRRKAALGFGTGMQLGSMVGDIGKLFVKGPQKTEAPTISTRTQGLTNLNQNGTNNVQSPTNNVVTTNTNSASPIPTVPLNNNPDSNMKQAKFGTSRRRCGLGVSLAYKSSRKKQTR